MSSSFDRGLGWARRVVAGLMAVGLASLAGCGDDSGSLPEVEPGSHEVEVTSALVYHQGDDRFQNAESLVDVVAPATGGPWPVVVAFHTHTLTRGLMLPLATEIANRGRVVFVPDWGHPDLGWLDQAENPFHARLDAYGQEVRCAVAFARAHAGEYGGDPEHITLFGRFFGANAALTVGFSEPEVLEACVETGPHVAPQAIVSWEAAPLLGAPDWDALLADEPEAFYDFTPWRNTDGSDEFPVFIATAEDSGSYQQSVGSVPADSFLANRHIDIDLVAELDEMGLLADGEFSIRDENEWAHQTLLAAGYTTELVLLPGSTPGSLSPEGRDLLIDTIVHAERG